MIDSSPDDVFSRVVSQLQVQGFDIDQFEKRDRTVKTAWKEIPVSEVETFAKLKEPAERYEKGRLAYQAKVEADVDNSRLFIDALVEALYTPHQRESEKFGIDKEWQAAKSNGSAERSFMDSIK